MATIDKDGVIFNQSSTGTPYSATGAQIRAPESDSLLGVIHSQTPSSIQQHEDSLNPDVKLAEFEFRVRDLVGWAPHGPRSRDPSASTSNAR